MEHQPLYKAVMQLYPWVSEKDARRIAHEAENKRNLSIVKGENSMTFEATIEILRGQKAAIITLTKSGEWYGASRISSHNLYEAGYRHASQMAAVKGGTLNRYREVS